MTPVHGEVRTVDDVASAFADVVVDAAPASIALSGGGTAEDAYRALAGRTLDWSGIDVWFGDERFVPVDDPDSNEGMARAVLLDRVGPRAIHSLAGAGDTVDAAALAYDAEIAAAPPIDVVHLGLGPDGHTASLFPGSAALGITDRLVVPNGDALHPHPRSRSPTPRSRGAASGGVHGRRRRQARRVHAHPVRRRSARGTRHRGACAVARGPRGPRLTEEDLRWKSGSSIARESIRDCIARYNANGDSGRIDQMVEVFAPDGIMETGSGRYEGRGAIHAFMSSVADRGRPRRGGERGVARSAESIVMTPTRSGWRGYECRSSATSLPPRRSTCSTRPTPRRDRITSS